MRLRLPAAASVNQAPWIATSEADIETIIQLEPSIVEEHELASGLMPREAQYQPMSPPPTILPDKDTEALRKKRSPTVFAIIAIATFGTAFAWWSVGPRRATEGSQAPVAASSTAVSPAVTSMPPKKLEAAPITHSEEPVQTASIAPDAKSDMPKIRARLANAEKAKIRRDAILKRKADNEAAKKAELAGAVRAQNADRVRTSTSPNTKDESPRPAKLKPALQTPQQACADRSNFISRGICESRECEKPERVALKFCIDMHERRAPRD